MGSQLSVTNKCNYLCPICRLSGQTPNIAGRFFIINDYQCQCNGCNTKYNKTYYYYPHRINNRTATDTESILTQ